MTKVASVSPVVLRLLKKKAVNTRLLRSQLLIALSALVVPSANAVAITKAAKDNHFD
jgi:hypothetical protein